MSKHIENARTVDRWVMVTTNNKSMNLALASDEHAHPGVRWCTAEDPTTMVPRRVMLHRTEEGWCYGRPDQANRKFYPYPHAALEAWVEVIVPRLFHLDYKGVLHTVTDYDQLTSGDDLYVWSDEDAAAGVPAKVFTMCIEIEEA